MAKRDEVRGKVFASFVIDKDGSITDVKIEKPLHPLLDNEAKRVLLNAPKWVPGKYRGFPTRIKYNQALNFNL